MSTQVASGGWVQPLQPNPIFGGGRLWQLNALGSFTISNPIDVTGYDRMNIWLSCSSGPVAGEQVAAILVGNWLNPRELVNLAPNGAYQPFIQFDTAPIPTTLPAGTSAAIGSATPPGIQYVDINGDEGFSAITFSKKLLLFPPTTVSSGYTSAGIAVLDVAGLTKLRIILLKVAGVGATTVVQCKNKLVRLY